MLTVLCTSMMFMLMTFYSMSYETAIQVSGMFVILSKIVGWYEAETASLDRKFDEDLKQEAE